jgi:hypothetical protein
MKENKENHSHTPDNRSEHETTETKDSKERKEDTSTPPQTPKKPLMQPPIYIPETAALVPPQRAKRALSPATNLSDQFATISPAPVQAAKKQTLDTDCENPLATKFFGNNTFVKFYMGKPTKSTMTAQTNSIGGTEYNLTSPPTTPTQVVSNSQTRQSMSSTADTTLQTSLFPQKPFFETQGGDSTF